LATTKDTKATKQRALVAVRKPRPTDLARIAALLADLAGAPLSSRQAANRLALIARDPEQDIRVASIDGALVGVMGFRIRHNIESISHYGEVSALVVDGQWRRHGVGAALIDAAEKLARKRRCIGLWLVSGFGREAPAHRFYRRMGFTKNGVRFVRPLDT
jgi:GNAT superfamily N-acetyltransferase